MSENKIKPKRKQTSKKSKIKEFEQILRVQAEFENYKKRMIKEKETFLKYVLEDLIVKLLPVLDNFERALHSAKGSQDFSSFHQGVEMIYKELFKVLEKEGLTKIETKDKEFDPHLHEAQEIVKTPKCHDNIIIEELLKGYKLEDKVLRPALVKVARHK